MLRNALLFCFLCCAGFASAQTYTFECVASGRLSGDSCDICPNTIIESRSFNGLVIFRDSAFYRWLDQPYSIRVKPGDLIEYWEHGANPYSERVTIPLSLTGFSTIQGMADSTWCNSTAPQRFQELSLDSLSATLAKAKLLSGNTGFGLRAGQNIVFDFQQDTLEIAVDTAGFGGGSGTVMSVAATAPAAGFTISGSPITTAGTFVFALADDLAAVEGLATTGIVARTAANTWTTRTITAGAGISIADGDGVLGNPTITNTDPDQSTTNEVQTYSHGGTTTYTNTLSSGGGSWSITGAGIAVISQAAGAVTVTATEVDGSVSNELQTIANTSDATSHTATLSNAGGSLQLVEGTGITLTTTGTGLDGILTIASTAGTNYQTMRDNGANETQRAALNFISSGRISATLTDDAANNETEATFDVVANSIANTHIRQGVARSVIGVTGNATANVADIQGTADQVLRVTTAGTALAFGTVATGGIADDAVTYAKIQNVVNDDVFLGRISGAGGNVEELTAANAYSILGLTGVANRFALWTGTNTLASDVAFAFDGANDRATFTGTVAGVGANTGILNLNSGAIAASTTFLRMSGNITNSMIAEIVNANNAAATANSLFTISVGGANAGDAVVQFNVAGQMTHAIGIDNTDDRFKITPNASTPGATAGMGIIVRDNGGVGNTGINNDFPTHPLTIEGRTRSDLFLGEGNQYTSGNLAFGTGAGTGPTLTSIVGTGNAVMVRFSTGTTPTASGNVFTITYPTAFLTKSMANFSAGCDLASAVAGDNAATDFLKFKISQSDATTFVFKAVGTLAASTAYAFTFNYFGY